MRNKAAWLRVAAGLAAATLVLTACSQKQNSGSSSDNGGGAQKPSSGWPATPEGKTQKGKAGGTFRLGIQEPTAIDPWNSQESEGILVTKYLFTGLVQADNTGNIHPGVAEKWDTNDDCTEWTFHLKTGTTFHNGETVDAESFKRGWERVAAKSSASGVSYHLSDIKGFDEMQAGTAKTLSGVDASDPATLKVALSHPNCEFDLRTFHTVFSPVPKVAGDPNKNKAYVDAPIGNGPFMMDGKWQHDKGMTIKRFDDYKVGPKAYLDKVEISITANGNADEYAGFQNGTFDWARMPTEVLSQARSSYLPKHEWITKNTNGMNYLLPMLKQKPLDSADARKAISYAIDRDAIINSVFQGSQTPATSFIPPAFPKPAYQPGVCTACKFDLKKAKDLAKKAGLTPGTPLKMQFNVGAGHDAWMAAVKDQLQTNLGLKVDMTSVPFDDMLTNERQPNTTGLFRSAWGADYLTCENYLTPLLSTDAIQADAKGVAAGDNKGRYSNPEFDDLLKQFKAETDKDKRIKLCNKAEKIAIGDDMAEIPLWNRTQHRLINIKKFINIDQMDFNENPRIDLISVK